MNRPLNDELPQQVASFYATDATTTITGGTVLEGRDAIVEAFIRPVVARIPGLRAVSEPTVRQGRVGRRTLRTKDSTRVLGMVDRWGLAARGLDPGQPAPWQDEYEPRYLRSGGAIA